MDNTFKALADPTRRKILEMLGEKSLTAGAIAEAFNMTKPSISHHLNVLKSADLVYAERDGQNIIYSLNSSVVQEAIQQLMNIFKVGEEEHDNDKS